MTLPVKPQLTRLVRLLQHLAQQGGAGVPPAPLPDPSHQPHQPQGLPGGEGGRARPWPRVAWSSSSNHQSTIIAIHWCQPGQVLYSVF